VHGIVDVDLDLQHCVAVKAAGDEGLAYTLVGSSLFSVGSWLSLYSNSC